MAPEGRHALRQLTGLCAFAGIVVIGGVLSTESPADAAELRITVGELRSQAAELAVLDDQGSRGRLAGGYERRHLEQLRKAFTATLRDLREHETRPELASARRDALALAARLERNFDERGRSQSSRAAEDLRDGLQRIEDGLRQPA